MAKGEWDEELEVMPESSRRARALRRSTVRYASLIDLEEARKAAKEAADTHTSGELALDLREWVADCKKRRGMQ